ncbi:hypothetical protein FOL47_010316 [Perkinsus chesapeaki]|uniref:Uncharacterized protein n=1 Tax=Perkinsus chesapeaki TaxID=330153 RepID=A0A7J6L4B1_PERCH|nr:hypothetical protein FOL47_010316 [Perkinsus chesapeaki]
MTFLDTGPVLLAETNFPRSTTGWIPTLSACLFGLPSFHASRAGSLSSVFNALTRAGTDALVMVKQDAWMDPSVHAGPLEPPQLTWRSKDIHAAFANNATSSHASDVRESK